MIKRRHLTLLVQVLIAAGIFTIIFRHIDLQEALAKLSTATPSYMIAALALMMLQIIVAALRWIQLLKIADFKPSVGQFIQSFTISSFVNTAVPGGIGGDAMRVWATVRSGASFKLAMHIILLDRIISLLGLSFLVIGAGTIRYFVFHEFLQPIYIVALIVSAVPVATIIALIFLNPLLIRCSFKHPRFLSIIKDLSSTTGGIIHRPRQSLLLGLWLMLTHLLTILVLVCLAKGLHISLPLFDAISSLPSALLLSSIPITPGGWGVREGAMVLVLKQFSVNAEAALTISILFGLLLIIAHLPIMLTCFYQNTLSVKTIIHEKTDVAK